MAPALNCVWSSTASCHVAATISSDPPATRPASNLWIFCAKGPNIKNRSSSLPCCSWSGDAIPGARPRWGEVATFLLSAAEDSKKRGSHRASGTLVRSSRNNVGEFQCHVKGEDIGEVRILAEEVPIQLAAAPRIESLVNNAGPGSDEEVKGTRASYTRCQCHTCGRRGLLASFGGLLVAMNVPWACASDFGSSDYNMIREAVHPGRPVWYSEFYARSMAHTMAPYEKEIADYKRELFLNLDENVEQILELGIGTGPNLKYYARFPHLQRIAGLDPNLQMAKYCRDAAKAAGLSSSQFEFFHAVGEGIPVPDETMDAVVCTLVLCSVSDVSSTLQEVKRVLKPGGAFIFVEHVAAPEGTGLRFWQAVLDPLQQWVADGCHLTRDTLKSIQDCQFGSLQSKKLTIPGIALIGPHVLGVARK